MIRLEDVRQTRARISGQLVLTPCTPSRGSGEMLGGEVCFKFENLQRTGSFMERGALNRILTLSATRQWRKR